MNEDKSLRQQAIPYLGQVMNYCRNEFSDTDVMNANTGDLFAFFADAFGRSVSKNCMIRILRPKYAQIISAYLSLGIITDPNEPNPRFRLTVGTGYSSGTTALVPDDNTIQTIHTKLTGKPDPFANTAGLPIVVDKLDITKFIPKIGDPNYCEDCFVIGVHFDSAPVGTNSILKKFDVDIDAVIVK